jgi:hypothetical protein
MATRYAQAIDARWFRMPLKAAKHVACCDCGLTHKFKFHVTATGVLMMAVWRDDAETAKVRRRYARALVAKVPA